VASDLVHNERRKYVATWLNTIAATVVAVGVIAPLVALSYGVPGSISGGFAVLISLAWLATGLLLHMLVHVVLGTLKP
jgi:hypothetical protein